MRNFFIVYADEKIENLEKKQIKVKVKFRGVTHRNGGFGHHISKYNKNPLIKNWHQNNRKREDFRKVHKAKQIKKVFQSVIECVSCRGEK